MLNNVSLVGRITADPELRKTGTDRSVLNITVAVSRPVPRTAERRTDFIPVVIWGKTADFVAANFHKSDFIAVQGTLQSRHYETETVSRNVLEVIANKVDFCGYAKPKVESDENPIY